MRKIDILLYGLVLSVSMAHAGEPALQGQVVENAQVKQVNEEIDRLEAIKRGYEARALRHEDQADRLQFDDQTYLEMRRHNQMATENRRKAAAVQKEIDHLKAEKAKLIQK